MNYLFHLGRYFVLMKRVFARPEKHRIFFKQIVQEMEALGINSIGIVGVISIFLGAVIALQTAYNIEGPFIPLSTIGYLTRDTMILELSSTIVCLILAGKVGSNIASEIGTMSVTEQIDALETMGVNSASYLILPKIIAFMLMIPFLVAMSMVIGMFGGYLAGVGSGVVSANDFIYGLRYYFIPYYIVYSLIKGVVFAFVIASVSSYYGYYTEGSALEVGRSSTRAVVSSSLVILLFNLILTQILLA